MRVSPKQFSRRRFLRWLGAGSLVAGGGLVGHVWLHEPHAVRVEHLELATAKLPAGRQLRLVQLSDLHIRTFHRYYKEVARRVNALQPELVVLTGDYLEQDRNLKGVRRFLQLLQAPAGLLAVQGNWEYWSRLEGETLRRQFARSGATLLINQRHDPLPDLPLSVCGLDYPSAKDDLQQLQRQADPRRFNLLLSHVPAFAHQLLDDRWDLILCGHTHGGQVRVPMLPPLYLPRFTGKFISGLFRVGPDEIPLYVNRGIGTSVLGVRLLCPPEITLITLRGTA